MAASKRHETIDSLFKRLDQVGRCPSVKRKLSFFLPYERNFFDCLKGDEAAYEKLNDFDKDCARLCKAMIEQHKRGRVSNNERDLNSEVNKPKSESSSSEKQCGQNLELCTDSDMTMEQEVHAVDSDTKESCLTFHVEAVPSVPAASSISGTEPKLGSEPEPDPEPEHERDHEHEPAPPPFSEPEPKPAPSPFSEPEPEPEPEPEIPVENKPDACQGHGQAPSTTSPSQELGALAKEDDNANEVEAATTVNNNNNVLDNEERLLYGDLYDDVNMEIHHVASNPPLAKEHESVADVCVPSMESLEFNSNVQDDAASCMDAMNQPPFVDFPSSDFCPNVSAIDPGFMNDQVQWNPYITASEEGNLVEDNCEPPEFTESGLMTSMISMLRSNNVQNSSLESQLHGIMENSADMGTFWDSGSGYDW